MAYSQGNRGKTEQSRDREVEALRLRQKGFSYRKIADELGVSGPTALKYVRASLERLAKENQHEAGKLLELELSRLDDLYEKSYAVLEATHYMVSGGQVVQHGDVDLLDDGPLLRAVDRLIKISERRCALLGIDAPKPTDVNVSIKNKTLSKEELIAELAARGLPTSIFGQDEE